MSGYNIQCGFTIDIEVKNKTIKKKVCLKCISYYHDNWLEASNVSLYTYIPDLARYFHLNI